MCPSGTDLVKVKLSAYADDVTVVIRSDEDVKKMIASLNIYQRVSSSRINWNKCSSFLLGKWENGGPPVLPQHCSWSLEGFKVLGVFMGKDHYMEKNWEGLIDSGGGFSLNIHIGVECLLLITWLLLCCGIG